MEQGKTYSIRVSSQKGGVGKTTIAVNLAIALQYMGYNTLLIDADTVNPSVAYQLDMLDANTGIYSCLVKKTSPEKAIAIHQKSGLRVLPGCIGDPQLIPDDKMRSELLDKVNSLGYDFVVIDSSTGYIYKHYLENYDNILLVSTFNMPSLMGAMRMAKIADKMKIEHSLVMNLYYKSRYELQINEVKNTYSGNIIGIVPNDKIVLKSIDVHEPAFMLSRRSKFSKAITKIANYYIAKYGLKNKV